MSIFFTSGKAKTLYWFPLKELLNLLNSRSQKTTTIATTTTTTTTTKKQKEKKKRKYGFSCGIDIFATAKLGKVYVNVDTLT